MTKSKKVGVESVSSPVEFNETRTLVDNSPSRIESSLFPDSYVIYALGIVI